MKGRRSGLAPPTQTHIERRTSSVVRTTVEEAQPGPSLQRPALRAPQAGGLRPPQAGGLRPPQAGGLRPPQAGGLRPPQAGGLRPPQAGALRPPQAGALRPPSAPALRPPQASGLRRPQAAPSQAVVPKATGLRASTALRAPQVPQEIALRPPQPLPQDIALRPPQPLPQAAALRAPSALRAPKATGLRAPQATGLRPPQSSGLRAPQGTRRVTSEVRTEVVTQHEVPAAPAPPAEEVQICPAVMEAHEEEVRAVADQTKVQELLARAAAQEAALNAMVEEDTARRAEVMAARAALREKAAQERAAVADEHQVAARLAAVQASARAATCEEVAEAVGEAAAQAMVEEAAARRADAAAARAARKEKAAQERAAVAHEHQVAARLAAIQASARAAACEEVAEAAGEAAAQAAEQEVDAAQEVQRRRRLAKEAELLADAVQDWREEEDLTLRQYMRRLKILNRQIRRLVDESLEKHPTCRETLKWEPNVSPLQEEDQSSPEMDVVEETLVSNVPAPRFGGLLPPGVPVHLDPFAISSSRPLAAPLSPVRGSPVYLNPFFGSPPAELPPPMVPILQRRYPASTSFETQTPRRSLSRTPSPRRIRFSISPLSETPSPMRRSPSPEPRTPPPEDIFYHTPPEGIPEETLQEMFEPYIDSEEVEEEEEEEEEEVATQPVILWTESPPRSLPSPLVQPPSPLGVFTRVPPLPGAAAPIAPDPQWDILLTAQPSPTGELPAPLIPTPQGYRSPTRVLSPLPALSPQPILSTPRRPQVERDRSPRRRVTRLLDFGDEDENAAAGWYSVMAELPEETATIMDISMPEELRDVILHPDDPEVRAMQDFVANLPEGPDTVFDCLVVYPEIREEARWHSMMRSVPQMTDEPTGIEDIEMPEGMDDSFLVDSDEYSMLPATPPPRQPVYSPLMPVEQKPRVVLPARSPRRSRSPRSPRSPVRPARPQRQMLSPEAVRWANLVRSTATMPGLGAPTVAESFLETEQLPEFEEDQMVMSPEQEMSPMARRWANLVRSSTAAAALCFDMPEPPDAGMLLDEEMPEEPDWLND